MAKDTLYNFDYVSPTAVSREEYTNVGAGDNIVGDVKRTFVGSTFEIWDSAAGGNQLVLDTDYELIDLDPIITQQSGYDVYTGYRILNVAYQAGNIYITYDIVGSYIDADTINTMLSDIITLQGAIAVAKSRKGLEVSNIAGDTDHDVTIAIGKCSDEDLTYYLELTATLTKQSDAAFSPGDNAGGMFPGAALANNTWYGIFLIRKDSDGSIDAGFDTDPDAANIPAGYTAYRRIGWRKTDGSANFKPMYQVGNRSYFTALTNIVSANNPGAAAVAPASGCPIDTIGLFNVILFNDGLTITYLLITPTSTTDRAPSATDFTCRAADAGVSPDYAHRRDSKQIQIPVDASNQIRYRLNRSDADITVTINADGWDDYTI